MSLIATQYDYEPDLSKTDYDPAPLYWPCYTYFPEHTIRAEYIIDNYGLCKIVVWGCAFGYLVDELTKLGADAAGFDASRYAIGRGKELLPDIADKLHIGDCRYAIYSHYDLCVTEDMLPCFNDRELPFMLPKLRIASDKVLHIVTPHEHGTDHDIRINWKTLDEWKELLKPDKVVDSLCR